MSQAAQTRSPAQLFALVFGAVYLLVGIVGFFVTGFDEVAGKTYDEKLIVFALNPLHNVVHLAIGAVWIAAASKHPSAKGVNLLFGVVLGLVAVLGFAGALNWLAIENAGSADNLLHTATAILAVYFGTAGSEATASRPANA